MFKKALNITSVLLALAAIVFVIYGVRTNCPDVSIYIYCEQALR
jgi:hypothetical protein